MNLWFYSKFSVDSIFVSAPKRRMRGNGVAVKTMVNVGHDVVTQEAEYLWLLYKRFGG